ncbi:MAG: serine/threonine protein kinase [Gemmatimonadetes bacterium]|nr:serine/threonine protein kinase [Gemmatimonadota bacterium]
MRQALDRLLVGRTLADRYRIEALIGTGGMSVVYRGHDLTLGRPVAVKVVSLDAASEEDRERLRARFRREAGSAARIPAHPNVVQIHDFGTDPELELDFIVMELMEGRDLKQALATDPPRGAEAVRVLRDAARGLAAGHRAGIVHRDVKPANVFLVGGGDGDLEGVRVLDFGIAKPLDPEDDDDLTRTGLAPHSPAYASPEQRDTERPVTAASDVYSLGLIAYELLAGRRPFDDAQRIRIRAGEQVPLPERGTWASIPAPLRAVVERALRTRPEERYADAAEMAEALSAAREVEAAGPFLPAAEAADDATHADGPASITPAPAAEPVPSTGDAGHVDAGAEPGFRPISAEPSSEDPSPEEANDPFARRGAAPTSAATQSSESIEAEAVAPERRGRIAHLPRWAVILPVAVVVLLGLWLLGHKRSDAHGRPVAADTGQLAALDDEFLRLEGAAATSQPPAAARPSASLPAASPTPDTMLDPAREQAALQQVIYDVHDAFVKGDLPRLLSHYAPEVRYHQRRPVSLAEVQSTVGQVVAKYPDRAVTIKRDAITFPEPGHAKALVDRDWHYRGPSDDWTGSDRLSMLFERQAGAWKITSERRQTTHRSRHHHP